MPVKFCRGNNQTSHIKRRFKWLYPSVGNDCSSFAFMMQFRKMEETINWICDAIWLAIKFSGCVRTDDLRSLRAIDSSSAENWIENCHKVACTFDEITWKLHHKLNYFSLKASVWSAQLYGITFQGSSRTNCKSETDDVLSLSSRNLVCLNALYCFCSTRKKLFFLVQLH